MRFVNSGFIVGIVCIMLFSGCGVGSDQSNKVEDVQLIIPGKRVGPFIIGRTTKKAILGQDTPEKRDKYFKQGIEFSFNRFDHLSAITIHTHKFETSEGVKVGSSMSKVHKVYGEPLFDHIKDPAGEVDLPGYVYDGITFLEYNGSVAAIIVMEKVEKKLEVMG